MRVLDLMTSRLAECSPEESIQVAAQRMDEFRCGCLPVMESVDGKKRLVGIVTDRDLACRAVAQGRDPGRTEVSSCMSFPVQTITSGADLGECAERFTAIGVRRLIVVDECDHCVGIISRADLQRFVVDETTKERESAIPVIPTSTPHGNQPSGSSTRFISSTPQLGNEELTL